MGDVTDLEAYRKQIREATEKKDDDSIIRCLKCGDMLCFVALVPEFTDVDEGGPYALICQHCGEPWGSAYLFDEEDLEES